MLMAGALERLEAARELDLGGRNSLEADWLKDAAVALIGELRAGLDLHFGGAFAANVDDLYDYMCRRLTTADPGNGFAALHEVSHLLDALHSAWPFMPDEVRTALRN